jgi:hypothetical protein
MTARIPRQGGAHEPRVVTVRCDECRGVYAYSQGRCPQCGDNCVDPLVVVCGQCTTTWPCPPAAAGVDDAMRAWALGDYGFQAAVEIVLNTHLRQKMVPRYVSWAHYEVLAVPDFEALAKDFEDGDAYLSTSELFVFRLAANIAYGPTPEAGGAPVDLRGLFSLSDVNRDAVLTAISAAVRREALAVAR